eukprot:6198579-Pleurochrysis_carterae.AAC.3
MSGTVSSSTSSTGSSGERPRLRRSVASSPAILRPARPDEPQLVGGLLVPINQYSRRIGT